MASESVLIPGAAFTVVLVNRFGQILNRDGSLFLRMHAGQRPYSVGFDTIAAARAFCDAAVRDMPHVECNVIDASGAEALRLFDEAWLQAEHERIRELFANARRRDRRIWAMIITIAVAMGAGVVWWIRR